MRRYSWMITIALSLSIAPKRGEPDGRCPYCSFMPTNRNDFCDTHRKEMR